jgi:hypothetical protein
MKIRFIRNVLVEVEKTKLQEMWDYHYPKWKELLVESINYSGKSATICTMDKDILADVPIDSFEVVK